MEAVGVVTAIGPGVCDFKVGDVVYHSGSAMGTYTEEQIVLADKAMVLPVIDPLIVASVMVKGLTARFLVRTWFKVEQGHKVLVHAAAGGVGSVLCQWANMLGATVIGTVSTKEKALQAKEDGCHHVIIYNHEDFVTRVDEITSGDGVDVVFDSVGKDTFQVDPQLLPPRKVAVGRQRRLALHRSGTTIRKKLVVDLILRSLPNPTSIFNRRMPANVHRALHQQPMEHIRHSCSRSMPDRHYNSLHRRHAASQFCEPKREAKTTWKAVGPES